ncbi:CLUMA_CG014126, isoform A [Clunio marinus]|uniref:CLUMA_CG014126, isoform A n=1 Tax=Clunio marinus TaxID=568069 RepID=A0A1J1IKX9_9DIPT|nr:CLUMA_CG014126, isoform A [Clunio marinus]
MDPLAIFWVLTNSSYLVEKFQGKSFTLKYLGISNYSLCKLHSMSLKGNEALISLNLMLSLMALKPYQLYICKLLYVKNNK